MARRFDRLGWAMSQDIPPTQKFVLLVLADAANEVEQECWLKHATIAERTGYGITTVRDAIRDLKSAGLLESAVRYDRGGRQTSNLYRLVVDEGVGSRHPDEGEGVASRQGEVSAGDTSTRTNQKQPPSRKNNSLTTSKSRSSTPRSARRSEDDGEWTDPARAALDEQMPVTEVPEANFSRRSTGGPDSAYGLAKYYSAEVAHYAPGASLGNTNEDALRKFFAEAKRAGVTADTLRRMVDAFIADGRLFSKAKAARWRVFIANAENLRQRVTQAQHEATKWDGAEDDDTGIPQHLLDEILAEAG